MDHHSFKCLSLAIHIPHLTSIPASDQLIMAVALHYSTQPVAYTAASTG